MPSKWNSVRYWSLVHCTGGVVAYIDWPEEWNENHKNCEYESHLQVGNEVSTCTGFGASTPSSPIWYSLAVLINRIVSPTLISPSTTLKYTITPCTAILLKTELHDCIEDTILDSSHHDKIVGNIRQRTHIETKYEWCSSRVLSGSHLYWWQHDAYNTSAYPFWAWPSCIRRAYHQILQI